MMGSLDSEQTVLPLAADSQAVYASGHLLFVREGTLMAQPFDAKALTLGGAAFSVAEQVASDRNNGIAAFDASENGVLTYRTGASAGNMQLTWFDRTGKILGTIDQPGAYNSVTLSPDGARVASSRIDSTGNEDIWVDEFARGTSTRLTFDPARTTCRSGRPTERASCGVPPGTDAPTSIRRHRTARAATKPS